MGRYDTAMKYLVSKNGSRYKFDEYFEYLDSISSKLDRDTYSFASNWDHYSLDSKTSLHDSWLENIEIKEVGSGDRKELRSTMISIKLLGPYHDRHIILNYENVINYSIKSGELNGNIAGHGDLLMHEVQFCDPKHVSHEIEFADGSVYLITSEKIKCEQSLIE